jgi:hypothetical protein
VPDVCTCGAVLPPDARFCHKCGKPQRDEPLFIQEEAPIQRPIEPPGLPPLSTLEFPRIGFHNGLAVRVALLAGVLAFFCSIITGQLALPQEFALVWLVAGGFFAVYLYERRTGQRLSVRSGAHLGWICGVFGFVVVTMALAATAVMLSDPSVASAMREQLRTHGIPAANAEQMIAFFHTPAGISSALFVSFVLFTVLPAFGGAVGAKLLDRD